MDVFRAGAAVSHKADLSPVTEADRAASSIILAGLRAAHSRDLPCVAEEECGRGSFRRALGDAFLLVDPLDGTSEFVNRRPISRSTSRWSRRPAAKSASSSRRCAAASISAGRDGPSGSRSSEGFDAGAPPADRVRDRLRAARPSSPAARTAPPIPTSTSCASAAGRDRLGRLVAEILPDRQRRGRPLSALRPDHGMGHRRRRCRAARRRRHDRRRSTASRSTYGKRGAPVALDFANPYFIARGRTPPRTAGLRRPLLGGSAAPRLAVRRSCGSRR